MGYLCFVCCSTGSPGEETCFLSLRSTVNSRYNEPRSDESPRYKKPFYKINRDLFVWASSFDITNLTM